LPCVAAAAHGNRAMRALHLCVARGRPVHQHERSAGRRRSQPAAPDRLRRGSCRLLPTSAGLHLLRNQWAGIARPIGDVCYRPSLAPSGGERHIVRRHTPSAAGRFIHARTTRRPRFNREGSVHEREVPCSAVPLPSWTTGGVVGVGEEPSSAGPVRADSGLVRRELWSYAKAKWRRSEDERPVTGSSDQHRLTFVSGGSPRTDSVPAPGPPELPAARSGRCPESKTLTLAETHTKSWRLQRCRCDRFVGIPRTTEIHHRPPLRSIIPSPCRESA